MKQNTKGEGVLTTYLDEVVYPALHARLDRAFPEFGWRRNPKGWTATRWPETFPVDATTRDPGRLSAYSNSPWRITCHGRLAQPARFLDLIAQEKGLQLHGDGFVHAVRALAELAGVEDRFPERKVSAEEVERRRVREVRGNVLEEAVKLLRANVGPKTLEYCAKRGLSTAYVEELELGFYATKEGLRRGLLEKGFSEKDVEESGVVFASMEGRLVFPWRDEEGRLITLYGRCVGDPPEGKKRQMGLPGEGSKRSPLYLDRVISSGSNDLVLVEGLFDAAVLRSMGDERVATFAGGQLSADQLDAVARRGFRRVFIVGDPDAGGDEGTLRNAAKLREAGVPVFIPPRLPDGVDPDEFALGRGIEAWRDHVARSTRAAAWLAAKHLEGITPSSTDAEKEEVVRRCLDIAGRTTGDLAPLDVEDIASAVASATGYSPEAIARVEAVLAEARLASEKETGARAAIERASAKLDDGEEAVGVGIELRVELSEIERKGERVAPYSTESMLRAIRDAPDGLHGGLGVLDDEVAFRPGELALVAARPGHGKTSVMVHLLHRWLLDGRNVVLVSLEEKQEDIFCRLVARWCAEAKPHTRWSTNSVRAYVRGGGDSREEWPGNVGDVDDAIEEHRRIESRLRVIYAPHAAAGRIRGLVDASGLRADAVLVDYLQKIPPTKDASAERRDRQVSIAAQALKVASVELRVPFVAGVQVNRDSVPTGYSASIEKVAKDDNGCVERIEEVIRTSRPQLHHLREGGSEQEADLVLGILNYCADIPKDAGTTDRLDVGILKNRYGEVGRWEELSFDGARSMLSPREELVGARR